jgi:hypothetical protein
MAPSCSVVAGLSQRIGAGVAMLARDGDVVGAQVAGAVVAIVGDLGLTMSCAIY